MAAHQSCLVWSCRIATAGSWECSWCPTLLPMPRLWWPHWATEWCTGPPSMSHRVSAFWVSAMAAMLQVLIYTLHTCQLVYDCGKLFPTSYTEGRGREAEGRRWGGRGGRVGIRRRAEGRNGEKVPGGDLQGEERGLLRRREGGGRVTGEGCVSSFCCPTQLSFLTARVSLAVHSCCMYR